MCGVSVCRKNLLSDSLVMLGVNGICKCFNLKWYNQWIGALGGFSLMLQIGIMTGWLSPNIVRLTREDSEIPLTDNQISWLVSLSFLMHIVGGILGLISINWIGTKHTSVLGFLICGFSWICLIIANSVSWLLIGLILSGIACGVVFTCAPLFFGDIAAAKIRGTVIGLSFSGIPIGILMGTIMETYLPMKISSTIYLIHCLLSIILFMWLKRSPYELARKKQYDLAKISIAFYIPNADLEKELNDIKSFIEHHECRNIKDQLKLLMSTSVRKSLAVVIIIFSLPYFSGLINIISYMEVILVKAKLNIIKPEDFVIYTRIVSAIFTVLFSSMKLLDIFGRRFVWIVTSIGSAVATAGLGFHFYLLSLNFNPESLQWLPITSLLFYCVLHVFGYVTVPNAILSEIFPQRVKTVVAFIVTIYLALLMFLMLKLFQPMVDLVGEMYIFWSYAVFALLGVPSAFLLQTETTGKTFQNIQDDLNKKKNIT